MPVVEIAAILMALAGLVVSGICLYVVLRAKADAENAQCVSDERLAQLGSALIATQRILTNVSDKLDTVLRQQSAASAVDQQRFMMLGKDLDETQDHMDNLRRELVQQMGASRETTENRLEKVRASVETQLAAIREDNAHQLEQMRATVDEKLSRTLNDRLSSSFKQVSEQLEAVYKGLGDMQSIASGVGDLKRVLGNVKTRGILGEVQLGAILGDILAPGQYLENVATKPGTTERVEFAIKLPVDKDEPVLLPVDSKFPGDAYEHLLDAQDAGDAVTAAAARKHLDAMLKREAKDIRDKYLSVPATTNFGIMFLPFEGLYAEVVGRPGLIEELARDYHVNVAGPSTMAAMLNSLQMSYQTFKLQKRTDDVLRVLSAVKAELPRYQAALRRARSQIETAGKTVDGIITTRTNVMERTLKNIDAMEDTAEAELLLGTGAAAEEADLAEEGDA